jgi:opacity protein-like surface antigen
MKKFFSLALVAGLAVLPLSSAHAAAKPTQVFTDVAGDADNGQGLGASIPGGFDLVSGTVAQNGANIEFTATHADMPPSGSLPEGFRFLWAFGVGKAQYRLTVKSADIGKPDLEAGQTTERVGRVDATGHFRLEGNCTSTVVGALNAINCQPLAYVEGHFDPATMSFTAIVPMKLIKAKKGSVIAPGAGDSTQICATQICWVSHTEERSLNTTIIDSASVTGSFKVK